MSIIFKDNKILGALLILIGIISILIRITGIDLYYIPYAWPIFFIISGAALEISYLKFRKDLFSAFSGSVFFVFGLSSFVLNIFNIVPRELNLSLIYPEKFIIFTICLGISIAYSQTFIFSNRSTKYLKKAIVFTLICVINILFIVFNKFFMNLLIPTIVFGSGAYLIYLPFKYKY